MTLHHILEILFASSALLWIVTHGADFNQITQSMGSGFNSVFNGLIGR